MNNQVKVTIRYFYDYEGCNASLEIRIDCAQDSTHIHKTLESPAEIANEPLKPEWGMLSPSSEYRYRRLIIIRETWGKIEEAVRTELLNIESIINSVRQKNTTIPPRQTFTF